MLLCSRLLLLSLSALSQLTFFHYQLVQGEITAMQLPSFDIAPTTATLLHTDSILQAYQAPFVLPSASSSAATKSISGVPNAIWQWIRQADCEEIATRQERESEDMKVQPILPSSVAATSAAAASAVADSTFARRPPFVGCRSFAVSLPLPLPSPSQDDYIE